MISQADLNGFNGTEHYYKDFMNLNITDGVKYLMNNCRCGWLISDIAVINAIDKKVLQNRQEGNTFLIVTLKINRAEKSALWNMKEDTNEPILYEQKYDYTDIYNYFSDDEIKFYLINGVLLLESEY